MLRQDEGNPVFWLANNQAAMQDGLMLPRLEWFRKDKFAFWPWINLLLANLDRSRWIFSKVRFWIFMDRDIFEVNKNPGW